MIVGLDPIDCNPFNKFDTLLPQPGSMFTGPSYAAKQYGALLEELDKEIGVETQNLNSPGTTTIKAKSAERVRRLSAARDNVATILSQFGGNAPQTPPGQSVGITQQQYNALPSGATYTAPDGTQRVKQ